MQNLEKECQTKLLPFWRISPTFKMMVVRNPRTEPTSTSIVGYNLRKLFKFVLTSRKMFNMIGRFTLYNKDSACNFSVFLKFAKS